MMIFSSFFLSPSLSLPASNLFFKSNASTAYIIDWNKVKVFARDEDRYLMYRVYVYKRLSESNFYSVTINDNIDQTFERIRFLNIRNA